MLGVILRPAQTPPPPPSPPGNSADRLGFCASAAHARADLEQQSRNRSRYRQRRCRSCRRSPARRSQMVPMRREDHNFILQLRIAALGTMATTFRLSICRDLRPQFGLHAHAQRDRPEIPRLRRLQHLLHLLPAIPNSFSPASCETHPANAKAGSRRPTSPADLPFPTNSAPRPSRTPPWAWCERSMRPALHAASLFIFIGPAPVIGQRLAAENLGILRLRLVREKHDHLPLHVHVFVVVPLVLRAPRSRARRTPLPHRIRSLVF